MSGRNREHASKPQTGDPNTGCLPAALVIILIAWLIWHFFPSQWWLAVLIGVCAAWYMTYLLWGYINLWLAVSAFKLKGLDGILVYSNSPKWQTYIEHNWLPKFGDRFLVLNHSERKQWKLSVAMNVFDFFCGSINYCPSVLIFRGFRYPKIFRFFYAFKDAKHNNTDALEKLERLLLLDLGFDSTGIKSVYTKPNDFEETRDHLKSIFQADFRISKSTADKIRENFLDLHGRDWLHLYKEFRTVWLDTNKFIKRPYQ